MGYTINVVPGEAGALAEVLSVSLALSAFPASPSQPGDADTITDLEARGAPARRDDLPHDLVTRDQGQLGMLQFAVDDVEVGPAEPACAHCQLHLSIGRLRLGQIGEDQRFSLLG
jgi:hypothetical protein